jgi:hypothetical protein
VAVLGSGNRWVTIGMTASPTSTQHRVVITVFLISQRWRFRSGHRVAFRPPRQLRLRVGVAAAFQRNVPAACDRVKDESTSPAVSNTRVAADGLMLFPSPPHLGYSRVPAAL